MESPPSAAALVSQARVLLTLAVLAFYFYLKIVVYGVWRRRGIEHDEPSIPLGNLPISYFIGDTTLGSVVKASYEKHKKQRFYGIYLLNLPVLVINDPELIQLVLVKNFNNFYNRGTLYNESKDPLSTGIVRLYDEKWKRLREKLSPLFTSKKLKLMLPLVQEICEEMIKVFDDALIESNVLEIKALVTRFTIDCISSIAFGFNADSLHEPDSEFLKNGQISNSFGRIFLLISFFNTELAPLYPLPKDRKQVETFFVDLYEKMVSHRKQNNIKRPDFLNMIMQLVDYGTIQEDSESKSAPSGYAPKITVADKLTDTEAIGQIMIFFAAGQETTSAAITNCLYELALNQEVQETLYREIREVNDSPEGLTYDKLFDMPYLDMTFQETLRKHPGTPVLNRQCSQDFQIPGSDFCIKKGSKLIIPTIGLHMDPDIYPEPEIFDPTRFSNENKVKRKNCTHLPFGDGPRHCIGKRLGTLKPKTAIYYLILNYKFMASDKTPRPMTYLPGYFVQVPVDTYLKVEKR
ncbi:hypothetical protein TKK_0011189 [Trichogramma kaykai]|uniref:Cytochrome P450 n=1 Tax=Trichogramma kaykai TaxID=54128 RepID=A0ABD2WV94_9HYME